MSVTVVPGEAIAWPATAHGLAGAPVPPAPPLRGSGRTEVAIVGAGITGLSAALHLAEGGTRPVVLDRFGPGWGASGRNGGQVNPGLKPDPDAVVALHGLERGERLVKATWDAPDLVFRLIEAHGIDCAAVRGGTLRAAAAAADLPGLQSLAVQCARRGMPTALLDAAAVARRTGTTAYRAALLDRRGGQIDPLAYTRGLAAAAQRLGAAVHGASGVERLERVSGGWRLHGEGFVLQAERVILAGNGYTDGLWPGLARSIVPVFSAVLASVPLPDALRESLLPGREVLYELGSLTTYYRVDAEGRLLIGGRSASRSLRGNRCVPVPRPARDHAVAATGRDRLDPWLEWPAGADHRPSAALARAGARAVRRAGLQRPRQRHGHAAGAGAGAPAARAGRGGPADPAHADRADADARVLEARRRHPHRLGPHARPGALSARLPFAPALF